MAIEGAHVLVTGANRGIGQAFVKELLARGAGLIHAVGRDLESLEAISVLDRDRIRPVELDVTDAVGIAQLAEETATLDVLINNAGVECHTELLAEDAMAELRRVMEVNYFGVLNMSRAFAPVLARSKAAALVNVGSIAGVFHVAGNSGYSAAKAAQLMLSHGLRVELGRLGIGVVQVLPGFVDTDMASGYRVPKAPARRIAAATLDAVAAGESLVLPDPFARNSFDAFLGQPDRVMREPAAFYDELVAAVSKQRGD